LEASAAAASEEVTLLVVEKVIHDRAEADRFRREQETERVGRQGPVTTRIVRVRQDREEFLD
jgi:hypothetical protein